MTHPGQIPPAPCRTSLHAQAGRAAAGFTLIEMAIVLVIIGLIVGGIFVGQALIKVAQIQQTISEKESFDAAVNTFEGKYNCLPGDCSNASQLGLNTTSLCGNCNGNGDGSIGTQNDTSQDQEFAYFWLHLWNAGLISMPIPGSILYGSDVVAG